MENCDFCGKRIRFRFECQGADGRVFGVGRDCVNKVEPVGSPLRGQVEKVGKEKAHAALIERVERVKAILKSDPDFLRDLDHPKGRRGETMRDYIEFVLVHGGPQKLAAVSKIVEAAHERATR